MRTARPGSRAARKRPASGSRARYASCSPKGPSTPPRSNTSPTGPESRARRSTSTSVRGSSSSTRSAKHSTQTRHCSSSGKSSNSQTPRRRSTRRSPTASASGHPRTPSCTNSTALPRSTPPRRTSSTANATTAEESWNGSLATSTAPDGYATAQPPGRSTFSSCSPATRPSANSARPASPTGNSPQRSNRPHMICSSAAEARGSGAWCSRRTAALSGSVSRRRTDERRSAPRRQIRGNEGRDRPANQHSGSPLPSRSRAPARAPYRPGALRRP